MLGIHSWNIAGEAKEHFNFGAFETLEEARTFMDALHRQILVGEPKIQVTKGGD